MSNRHVVTINHVIQRGSIESSVFFGKVYCGELSPLLVVVDNSML